MDTQTTLPGHYLVIDFEATCCDRGTVPRHEMEIIEIGAVMVRARDLQVIDEFQRFVQPVRHRVLTPFCTDLTSIRQEDVEAAPLFAPFVDDLKAWLYQYRDFWFCSWGDYDLRQLHQDCAFHGLPCPITAPHVNVKRRMAEQQVLPRKPGLGQAIELAGLAFSGTPHRGIDDARNIARLLPWIFGDARLPKEPQRC